MEIIIKLSFNQEWDDYKDVVPELILEDAIRELADGVDYEIVSVDRE